MLKEIENIIDRMESDNIKFIRLQFVDLNGIPKSIAVPYVKDEMEDFFSEGMPFDGSSIEGFVEINSRYTDAYGDSLKVPALQFRVK